MEYVANLFIKEQRKYKMDKIVLPFVYSLLAIITLRDYLPFDSINFILGCLALPFTFQQTNNCRNQRYLWLAILSLGVSFFLPVKTILYFTIAFVIFFSIESIGKRAGLLSFVVIVFISPVFQYAANTFSFPIRLQLSELAGQILSLFGNTVQVKGNLILYHGNEFSVDPACSGLSMLAMSLLLGVMLIGFYQKKYKKEISWWLSLAFLSLVIAMNIVANLLRIILLIQFAVLPQNLAHEFIGIACLIIYVIIPAIYFSKLLVQRFGRLHKVETFNTFNRQRFYLLNGLLLIGILCSYIRINSTDTYSQFNKLSNVMVAGYQSSLFKPGILKLANDQSLIYIKFVRGFYDTDHNPTICWKGSGYTFQEVEKETFGSQEVYTATLINGNEKLYTAWWYSNGENNTIAQSTWRWEMLKGAKNYAIINVSAANKIELEKEVHKILAQHMLSTVFHHI